MIIIYIYIYLYTLSVFVYIAKAGQDKKDSTGFFEALNEALLHKVLNLKFFSFSNRQAWNKFTRPEGILIRRQGQEEWRKTQNKTQLYILRRWQQTDQASRRFRQLLQIFDQKSFLIVLHRSLVA